MQLMVSSEAELGVSGSYFSEIRKIEIIYITYIFDRVAVRHYVAKTY